MSASQDDAEMQDRYHMIKKKYQELRNLRIDSVIADTEDLRRRVDEHRRVHELATHELTVQNSELKKVLRDSQSIDNEINLLMESNQKLRNQMRMKDSILNVFLKHPEFGIRPIARGIYEMTYKDGDFVFTLGFDSTGTVQYKGQKCPPRLARQREIDFVDGTAKFRSQDIGTLCEYLLAGLKACNL